MVVNDFPDRTIVVDNEEYLYFGGTSYLGVATNPEFQQLLSENLKKWGAFYGSSRNANIQLSVYDEVEKIVAKQLNVEATLTVSSGTLAGKLVVDYLSKTATTFFHYPKTHPAILGNNSLPLFVDHELHPQLKNDIEEAVVITTDAILSLETTPTSFDFLDEISAYKQITLVVDESHSLGVVGNNGMGIFDTIPNQKICRKIMCASLGKALDLSGGIIASDKTFVDNLRQEAIFVSSSGANPAYLQTYIDAQKIYKEQREKLAVNLNFIAKNLNKKKDIKFDKNYPVIYSNSETIFTTLLEQKVVITSFKYPTYQKPMNRMVITANHTQRDLEKLIQILNKHDQ